MNYIGKICPYCKTELTENDDIVVCSVCEMPHHKDCWIENKSCTTFGCTGTIMGIDGEKIRAVISNCPSCGAEIEDGQKFCTSCGKPVVIEGGPHYQVAGGNQGYNAPQGVSNPYGAPQGNPNPYAASQGASNPYAAPQGTTNPYAAPQGTTNPYAAPQGTTNPYAAPQGASNPYGTPQGNPNPYGTNGSSQSFYGSAPNTPNPYPPIGMNNYSNADYADMYGFISKNQDVYFQKFNKMKITNSNTTWNWASFFFGMYWFAYRKMYLYAVGYAGISLLSMLIPVIGSLIGLALSICTGIFGNFIYMKYAETELGKAKYMDNYTKMQYISQKGGVSAAAVALSVVAWLLVCIILS